MQFSEVVITKIMTIVLFAYSVYLARLKSNIRVKPVTVNIHRSISIDGWKNG